MTESAIIRNFFRRNIRVRYIAANMFLGHWECDILRATPKRDGDYVLTEYEIKTSLADLRNDKRKSDRLTHLPRNYKQQILADGKRVNRFYYVLPTELWEKVYNSVEYQNLIPDWAGVICCTELSGKGRFGIIFKKHKSAKQLTSKYFRITDKLLDKFYYGYWNIKIRTI